MQTINLATVTHRFLLIVAIVATTTAAAFAQGSAIPKLLTDNAKLKAALAKATITGNIPALTCAILPKTDLKKYSDHLLATVANAQNPNAIMVDYTIIQINNGANNQVVSSRESAFFKFDFNCNTLESSNTKLAVNTGVMTVDGANFTLQKISENTFTGSRTISGGVQIINCTIRRASFYIESGFTFID